MATYEIEISQVVMMLDAQTEEEALSECEDILSNTVHDWGSLTVR